MKTYPINLVLENKLVILVGAGHEISRKIAGLLEVGAWVRVIAPTAHLLVHQYVNEEKIEWLKRRYRPGDLRGAFVVFAATNDPAVHDQIWAEGHLRLLGNYRTVSDRSRSLLLLY